MNLFDFYKAPEAKFENLSRKLKHYDANGKETEFDIKRNALIEVVMLIKEHRSKLTKSLKIHVADQITEEDPSLDGKIGDFYREIHNEIADCNHALIQLKRIFDEVLNGRL